MWIDTVVSTSFKYTLTYPKTKEKQKLPEIKKLTTTDSSKLLVCR